MELAKLPVLAQETVENPSSLARVNATETTLSLKLRVGILTASFLIYRFFRPRRRAKRLDLTKGVIPVPTSIGFSLSTGKNAL